MNFIPQTISKNTISAYKSQNVRKHPRKLLNSDDFTEWHKHIPTKLTYSCLQTLSTNWQEFPVIEELILNEDKRILIDSLPTNLPYTLTVPKIDDDLYWKRCYLSRWPNKPPLDKPKTTNNHSRSVSRINSVSNQSSRSSSVSRISGVSRVSSGISSKGCEGIDLDVLSWKRCFLEKHLEEAVEHLSPEEYDPQKIKELVDLCGKYVRKVRINQMKSPRVSSELRDRIPLSAVLSGLGCLTDLSICFKQTYVGDDFSWHVMETTPNDIKNLSRGLEKCNLVSFKVYNSDVNCAKAKTILQSLTANSNLQTLDFSHCKIRDQGVIAISRFLQKTPSLHTLTLTNNYIGSQGTEVLAFVLSQPSVTLRKLDLSLNGIGPKGGNFLARALMEGARSLQTLNLSGCGLTNKNLPLFKILANNSSLKSLNISNNKLGEDSAISLIENLQINRFLEEIDVRMCEISAESYFQIKNSLSGRGQRMAERVDSSEFEYAVKLDEELQELLDRSLEDVQAEEEYKEEIVAKTNENSN